jgi:branched-chain amino acid transport system permease protein
VALCRRRELPAARCRGRGDAAGRGPRLSFVVVQALTGLANASSLFLIAAGLTVIFGVTRVVNFAHGSFFMLGAYVAWTILQHLPRDPLPFVAGILLAALAVGAIGVVVEILLLRRIYRAAELFQLLATFGVVLIVQEAALFVWGPEDHTLSRPRWLRGAFDILGERFPLWDFYLIFVGPAVLALLWLLFTRTRFGILVRAATEDREMVAALGVDQKFLFTAVFALGAALAGLGGALALPAGSANLQMDLAIIAEAFVVVVVGGLGSVPGAYLAALLIAEIQAFGIVLLPKITLVLVFLVMALVLAVRPYGLLGRPPPPERGRDPAPVLRPTPRWLGLAGLALVALLALLPTVAGAYSLSLAIEIACLTLFAASLHFIMGPGGIVSFGHAAFFGLGAYAAALATKWLGAPMPLGLLASPLLAGLAGAAFGALVVRLSGVYLAMLTLAFAQIVWATSFQWVEFTGGDNGILGVWPAQWARDKAVFWWLALALCAGGVFLLRRMIFSPFGYALRAVRDSPLRAAAIGIRAGHVQWAAFAVAALFAGLSGGLYAYAKGSVFPTYVAIPKSVDALMMVLLGGVQTVAGPVVGAAAWMGLSDLLVRFTYFWRLALGGAIIALVLLFPHGIAGAAQRRLMPDA